MNCMKCTNSIVMGNFSTFMICSKEKSSQFPVLTFSSGPTNSMRGAAFLCQMQDAIVVDIGSTTTDIGVLVGGFPRQALNKVKCGGVMTNFQMPDVFSFALGGGSIVTKKEDKVDINNEDYCFAYVTSHSGN